MKAVISLFFLALSLKASATVDANTNVFLVSKHIQSDEYFVQIAPVIGCYGLPRGPELSQLTKPYIVNNVGCGMDGKDNINALTCGKVVSAVEADDFSTFKQITLDITNCDDKANPDFISTIRKVVRLNFATKTVKHPKLILITSKASLN